MSSVVKSIAKSNRLIETSYKLGSREQFFLLFLISQISNQDTEFKDYRINYKDITQLMNFDGRRRVANKDDVFKMMNNLNNQPIRFTEGDEDVQAVWISSLRFNKKTGDYTFTFGSELKPFLLQLKEHFTLYSLNNIVHLSGHSIRVYEVLKRHHFKKEPVILSIKDLKFWLNIEEKYPEYYEFKRWVLEPAKEELEKFADIRFTYREAEKEGKKIISLEFTIFNNEPQAQPTTLNILSNLGKRLALSGQTSVETTYTEVKAQRSSQQKQKIEALTIAKHRAFQFLNEKNINATFILDNILAHPKLNYEPIQGFEDIYVQIMWQFFESKSKSKEKAGTFVNWIKNDRLTDDAAHARFTEGVLERRKKMTAQEVDDRFLAKTMTFTAFEAHQKESQKAVANPVKEIILPNYDRIEVTTKQAVTVPTRVAQPALPSFHIEDFKKEFPSDYAQFLQQATEEYAQFYLQAGQKFDSEKNRENIAFRAKDYCQEWWKNEILPKLMG